MTSKPFSLFFKCLLLLISLSHSLHTCLVPPSEQRWSVNVGVNVILIIGDLHTDIVALEALQQFSYYLIPIYPFSILCNTYRLCIYYSIRLVAKNE